MKKEFKGAGKGKRPIVGYDHKKWNENFDDISWGEDTKMVGKIRRNQNFRHIYVYGNTKQ